MNVEICIQNLDGIINQIKLNEIKLKVASSIEEHTRTIARTKGRLNEANEGELGSLNDKENCEGRLLNEVFNKNEGCENLYQRDWEKNVTRMSKWGREVKRKERNFVIVLIILRF